MSSWKRQRTDDGYQSREGGYRGQQSGLRHSGGRGGGGAGGGAGRVMMCYNCQKPGHHKRDCPQPRPGETVVDEKTKWELELKVVIVEKTSINKESKKNMRETLSKLSEALSQDLNENRASILNTFFLCVKSLPVQVPVLATLVGLLNCQDPSFGAEVVQRLETELSGALTSHEEVISRLLVRFLACLTNVAVLAPVDLLDFCSQLLRQVKDAQLTFRQADRVINTVITAILWAGKDLVESGESDKMGELLKGLEDYFSSRVLKEAEVLRAFSAVASSSVASLPVDSCPIHQEDRLVELWAAFKQLKDADWETELIFRPHESFKDTFREAKRHKFKLGEIPSQAANVSVFDWPDLHIFPPESQEQAVGPIERAILMQHFSDIMFLFENVRKEGTKQMMALYTSFDNASILVETVFSHVFTLPNSPVLPNYYGGVFVDLVKAKPKLFPPLIGQAINFLFEHLPQVDVECRDRLTELLSLHLSNFGYLWPWSSWAAVSKLPAIAPQRSMVQDSLEACVRLAYWDRIEETLPDSVKALMPDRPTPAYRWNPKNKPAEDSKAETGEEDEKMVYIDFAAQLMQMLKAKDSSEKLEDWLTKTVKPRLGEHSRLRLVVPTLLHAGSKSFTHITALLTRYKGVLTSLTIDLESQASVISLLAEFWQHSHQHVLIVLDKLLFLKLVSAEAVVRWVFQRKSELCRRWVWCALESAIRTQQQRVELAHNQQVKQSEVLGEDTKDLDQLTESLNLEKKNMFLVVFRLFQQQLVRTSDSEDDAGMHELLASRFLQFCRKYVRDYAPFAEEVETAVFTSDFDDALMHQFRLPVRYKSKRRNSVPAWMCG
eukprot:g61629.t1